MLEWMLTKVICDTYEKEFRSNPDQSLAMSIPISIHIDHEKEDGYRHLELLIMWKGYVGVFVRETYTVIPLEGIDHENDCLKEGYDYSEGQTEWQCLSCHDSCWRSDGVERFIFKNRERLSGFSTISGWYKTVNLSEEELEKFRRIESAGRSR